MMMVIDPKNLPIPEDKGNWLLGIDMQPISVLYFDGDRLTVINAEQAARKRDGYTWQITVKRKDGNYEHRLTKDKLKEL